MNAVCIEMSFKMKYFELQDTPELKYAPRIKNLFGKILLSVHLQSDMFQDVLPCVCKNPIQSPDSL